MQYITQTNSTQLAIMQYNGSQPSRAQPAHSNLVHIFAEKVLTDEHNYSTIITVKRETTPANINR